MHCIFTHVPLSRSCIELPGIGEPHTVEAGRKSTGAIEIKTVEQHLMVLDIGGAGNLVHKGRNISVRYFYWDRLSGTGGKSSFCGIVAKIVSKSDDKLKIYPTVSSDFRNVSHIFSNLNNTIMQMWIKHSINKHAEMRLYLRLGLPYLPIYTGASRFLTHPPIF